jgi:hypothetical protein
MLNSRYYSASFDNLVKGITAFIFLLFGAITLLQWYTIPTSDSSMQGWPLYLMMVFFLSILLITWLWHPTGYTLSTDQLVIHRPVKPVVILVRDIQKVILPQPGDMRYTIRTFGNGGLFGIYGKFWNSKFGSMTWYATRRSHYILLELRDKRKIVITPDDEAMGNILQHQVTGETA